jgi:hypothetical protein
MVVSTPQPELDELPHIAVSNNQYMCAYTTHSAYEAILDSGCGGIGIVNPNLFSVSDFCTEEAWHYQGLTVTM